MRTDVLCRLFVLACAISVWSCGGHLHRVAFEAQRRLEQKNEPYDFFSLQRSWPDTVLDVAAWRSAIAEARANDQNEVARRGADPCALVSGEWTLQGPGNVSGRINTLAVHPSQPDIVLAGFSTGGIFRSADAGISWQPVFDDHVELSIGCIVFSPHDPSVVYAGTGDPNMPSYVYNGNGIYKSADGGLSWQYIGLQEAGIISKIIVHPNDPNLLYASTMGNPYVRNEHRGVYRSADGGQTWTRILHVSDQAGASDLVIDPFDSQTFYAAFWDRIRNMQESIIFGPHARIYKTVDGGQNWQQLGGGLPTDEMGRIGLAISQHTPGKLYAVYVNTQSRPGGLFRSLDGGVTWTELLQGKLNDAYANFGWYFAKIRLNPVNDEEVYFLGISPWRRLPNNNWAIAAGAHADCHDLVYGADGRIYLATDGGMYRNLSGTTQVQVWPKSLNLPTTQFYHTNYNPHEPDLYWGGAQDNGIQKGNAQGYNAWQMVISADGFHCAFDPHDPLRFWVETQNGAIHRTVNGGQSFVSGGPCLGTNDRCNWNTPFFISKHPPYRLYSGTYRAYYSPDGSGWAPISDDLTDGVIYGPRFHTFSCMDESPILPDKLFVGTTDGNVWRREPTGPWVKISAGLPKRWVTAVIGSPSDPNHIFTACSGFRSNDKIPHIHRSTDNGQTWHNISGDLPDLPVNDLFILPGHADSILFAATDGGVYFTRNGGSQWRRLGAAMPYVPAFDLEHNPARNQLVVATYARGIWTFPLDTFLAAAPPVALSLSGRIANEVGMGVEGVSMNQAGASPSDVSGLYALHNVAGCQTMTLTPYRNDAPLNGVTTFDLVKINQHILGQELIASPYRLIAADANRSATITAFDIVVIRRVILGLDDMFMNNASWRFVPESYAFPNPDNPFVPAFPEHLTLDLAAESLGDLDFVGVKVGDVTGDATPALQATAADRHSPVRYLRMANVELQAGETALLPFSGDWTDAAALQGTLRCDPGKLEALEVISLNPAFMPYSYALHPDGALSFAVENPAMYGLPSGDSLLFALRVRAREACRAVEALTMVEAPTPSLFFEKNGAPHALRLAPLAPETLSPVALLAPNPLPPGLAPTLWIHHAPTQSPWTLEVFDLQGGLRYRVEGLTDGGVVRRQLPDAMFREAGAYPYRVRIGGRVAAGLLMYGF
ncbi:MAG: hypothetical protein ACK4NS_08270 [Saprospiraceae bacterium]